MARFEGKVALVTGGGTGIGRAVTEALVAEGAKVVVTGRREAPLEALAKAHPDQVRYTTADVAGPDGPKAAVAFTVETFGRLDVLVNNAGVLAMGPVVETDDDALERLLSINVGGVVRVSREAIPHLAAHKGAIVNISSTVAQAAVPGAAAYSATKAAVERLGAALAVEVGPLGVRVNSVAPGLTETDMSSGAPSEMIQAMVSQTPLGRVGRPEDIAKAVVFLASEDASWITGQALQSSGGLML